MPGILPMKMIRVGSATTSRIAQACDRCRSKKIRCDGIRPCCTQCSNVGFECKTSDKLSRRAFPRGYTESLEDRVRGLEAEVRELKQLLDEKDEKIDMLSRLHSFSSPSRKGSSSLSPAHAVQIKAELEAARDDILHVEIPAPVQLGAPSTGNSTTASFIEAFEQKIQEQEQRPQNISPSALLRDRQPHRPASADAPRTPPRILSDQYINLFFQEWQPLLPVLHRATFLRVYEQYLAGADAFKWQNNKHAVAQLFLVFEISALSAGPQSNNSIPSYEHQWRRALYSTSSAPTIITIQCQVLAQLCYLLRADYTHLTRHRGIAVGMCHELGLHQAHKYHNLPTFEAETRKKVFWCQYVLDKFTSAATGVPTLLREGDISTEYPADVDDENLSSEGFSPSLPGEITKMSSALALFKLTRVLSKTLEHLYPAKASYQLSLSKLHALSDELDQWSEELPEHLRLRFCNDKPATNLVSCRSPILSLGYFYTRSLIHRPLLLHTSGSPASAATIVLAACGKHSLQILDLLDERRMNYTFPFYRKELLLNAGFSILWQSIDLDPESKLVKDNQRSLSLALTMLSRESSIAAIEFQRIVSGFMQLESRRLLSPKHININSPAAKLLSGSTSSSSSSSLNMSKDSTTKSTKKQLQAVASKFSAFKSPSTTHDNITRRATVPQTAQQSHSLSPNHRAGSTTSLSSTRSAPVPMAISTPSPLGGPHGHQRNATAINLDYFPIGPDSIHVDAAPSSTSSSTMLPPRKPNQRNTNSPNIANASWDNLVNTFDNTHNNAGSSIYNATTPGSIHNNTSAVNGDDWFEDSSWDLSTMIDFAPKANVPQSLLSFSGESMASGEDLFSTVGSGGSANGSYSSGRRSGEGYKGIVMPMDDEDENYGVEIAA